MRFASYFGILIILALLVSACSSTGGKDKIPEDISESQLYHQAQQALTNNDYEQAIKKLKALESRYPFGYYAEQTQLELIYAYYKSDQPEAAKAAADHFIGLHPKHPDVDYAYYMKGLADNTADLGFIERYITVDMSKRDPGMARLSFNDFSELVNRFPNSRYTPDAKLRMIQIRNQLAAYEVHVANYYLKRKAYVAALNRSRYIVEHFQRTPSVPTALAIMIESSERLGLMDAASRSLEVLKLNYPDSPVLNKEGQFVGYQVNGDIDPDLLSTVTFGLFGNDGTSKTSSQTDESPSSPQTSRSWLNILTFGLFGKSPEQTDSIIKPPEPSLEGQ